RGSGAQCMGAKYVQCKITIAQAKPGLARQTRERLHEMPALLRAPPAAALVRDFTGRIDDGSEIGRNRQSKMFKLVTRVHDDGHFLAEHAVEAIGQLCAANASAKRANILVGSAHRNMSWLFGRANAAAGELGPLSLSPRTRMIGNPALACPINSE